MNADTRVLAIITLARWSLARTRNKPRDDPDPEEPNLYGLPTGKPISRELKARWREYLKQFLSQIPNHPSGTELPHFQPLTLKTEDLTRRMTPLLGIYWSEAGQKVAARLGTDDPDHWKVTNPRLREAVHQQAHDFCQKTLETTDLEVNEAKSRLRDELAAGLVEHGEALPELRKRVKAVFGQMSDWKADQIAASETSRAVHAAQVLAATDSGVVAGFELLLSSDACPLCRRIATEAKQVPVGRAFAVVGSHPTYAVLYHPPLHPHCQCALIEILLPEYGGPIDPEWSETLQQPQVGLADWTPSRPVAKPRPEARPPTPKLIPTPPTPERFAADDYRSLGVEFKPSDQAKAAGDPTVVIDVQALDAAWRKDKDFYLGPGGEGPAGKPGAYMNFAKFLAKAKAEGRPIEQSRISLDDEGVASFIDGRHRFAVFRDMGLKNLPVSVTKADAKLVRELLGDQGNRA